LRAFVGIVIVFAFKRHIIAGVVRAELPVVAISGHKALDTCIQTLVTHRVIRIRTGISGVLATIIRIAGPFTGTVSTIVAICIAGDIVAAFRRVVARVHCASNIIVAVHRSTRQTTVVKVTGLRSGAVEPIVTIVVVEFMIALVGARIAGVDRAIYSVATIAINIAPANIVVLVACLANRLAGILIGINAAS
jgi:hypothetical protein